jgi:hypothetical protein
MLQAAMQQWKSRPIFVSSTFRDMQAERDHLRNFVFPRLEEELRKRRYHLEWIDLRQGVEYGEAKTEEQRELAVLKVCLAEIKRSRPFLIVLLGDRYGWVPSSDRMQLAAQEAGFPSATAGRSVTALEIEYGIFKESPEQQRQCFFYLREPLPYEKLPKQILAEYSEQFATDEQAGLRRKALKELKASLLTNPDIKSRLRTYKADWDEKKKCVVGLTTWGNQVFEDLWKELQTETSILTERDTETWEDVERASLDQFVERCSRDFTGREKTVQEIDTLAYSTATEGCTWGACITGLAGSGKSALFAEMHRKFERDSNIFLLSNAAGATIRGSRVDFMLRRWINELARFLEINNPLTEAATVENLDLTFSSLLGEASLKKRVIVMLDALDQFEPTPRAKHLTWRPKLWPVNARLVVTTLPGAEAESLMQLTGVCKIELPPLTEADSRNIAQQIWKRWHVPWNDKVWQVLVDKILPDGISATRSPLWTTLACEQLALLDADDFARAEYQFAADLDPQARLEGLRCDLAERMPPDIPGLYAWLLAYAEKIHGSSSVRAFVCAIALSRHGWRENDMQILVPRLREILENGASTLPQHVVDGSVKARALDRFDPQYIPSYSSSVFPVAELSAIRRTFRSNLILRNEMQWDFFQTEARASIQLYLGLNPEMNASVHKVIAAFLIEQRTDDPVRCDEITFHLLEGKEYALLQIFCGSNNTTHARELAAAVETFVDDVNRNGMARLIHISNSDVTPQLIDPDGNPLSEFDDIFDDLRKDTRRDVAKGWVGWCLDSLLPAIASTAPVSTRRSLIDLLISRLMDSVRDFPEDLELQRIVARAQFTGAELAVAQGDWQRARQFNEDALRIFEGLA